MIERKYLPTLAELLDRLSIVLLKAIFIEENRENYLKEIVLIEHDINVELNQLHGEQDFRFRAYDLRMIMMVMLANRWIWENESTVRSGSYHGDKAYEGDLLRATHSVNGVRSFAKNRLAAVFNQRQDLKIDCLADDLPREMGNWSVFE